MTSAITYPNWAKSDIDKFSSSRSIGILYKRNIKKFSLFLDSIGVRSFESLSFDHIKKYWNNYARKAKTSLFGVENFIIYLEESYAIPKYLHIAANRSCSRYVYSEAINLNELLQFKQYGPDAEGLLKIIPLVTEKVYLNLSPVQFNSPKYVLSTFAFFLGINNLRFSYDMAIQWLFQIKLLKSRNLTQSRNVFTITDLIIKKIEVNSENIEKHKLSKIKRKEYPLIEWLIPFCNKYLLESNKYKNEYSRNYKQIKALFIFSEFLKSNGCTGINKISSSLLNKFNGMISAKYKVGSDSASHYVKDFLLFHIIRGHFSLKTYLKSFSLFRSEYNNLKMLDLSIWYGDITVATFINNELHMTASIKTAIPSWGNCILDELENAIIWYKPKSINGMKDDSLRNTFKKMIILLDCAYHPKSFSDLKPSQILMLKDFFSGSYFYSFLLVTTEHLIPKFYLCLTKALYAEYCFLYERLPSEITSLQPGKWSWHQVFEKIEEVASYLRSLSYKQPNISSAKMAINCLCIICVEHKIKLSKELGYAWAKIINQKCSTKKYSFNVGIYILNCLLEGYPPNKEDIVDERNHNATKERNYPAWSRNYIYSYIEIIKSDHLGKSSIDQYHSAFLRFTSFLTSLGCASFKEITPELLKQFDVHDLHSSKGAKCSYNCRIRKFLLYLASLGVIDYITVLALPVRAETKVRPVKILSKDQISFIHNYVESSSGFLALRYALAAILSLHTGLRGSDIINLKLSDINFAQKKIYLIQNKTKVEIAVPLLEEIENLLFKYLQSDRGCFSDNNLMLETKAPYGRLRSNPLNPMIKNILKLGCKFFCSHDLRRTFASLMIEGGANCFEIASSLGHAGISNIDKYISLNPRQISQCYLSGKNFEYEGDDL